MQSVELFRPKIEQELERIVNDAIEDEYSLLRSMLAYHLGWEGDGAGLRAQGKRIRPVMLLLCAMAAGGDWQPVLPAAAGVELLHNFSLIHDDVEDGGELRHGRPTVWVKWGVPQAINAGDLMFTLANVAILRLRTAFPAGKVLQAQELFQQTCVHLTEGQFLDMWYEAQGELPLTAYWSMVAGKTAALLACCAEMGSMLGGADEAEQKKFRNFGHLLGMAFQVQDDYLGIWGESDLMGKSTSSDLFTRKKTLPVLYGLQQKGRFAARWQAGRISEGDIPFLAQLLEEEGGREYAHTTSVDFTERALAALSEAVGDEPSGAALHQLASQLLGRRL
jgi:geranylgeranyl diphosphate synthase type I